MEPKQYFPAKDLPLSKGLSTTFPQPPKKIACGQNHTASISNVHQDRGIFLANQEDRKEGAYGKHKPLAELYVWGRNSSNVLGAGSHAPAIPAPQRVANDMVPKDCFLSEKLIVGDPYEIATGTNHMMVLTAGTDSQKEETGIVWAMGLGAHGRLGVDRPPEEKDDTWVTEEKGMVVKFDGAYRVVLRPEGFKTDGINYYTNPDRDTRDRKAVAPWSTNIHGNEIRDADSSEWLRVEDEKGVRYLPMTENGVRVILPVRLQILRIACGSDHTIALANNGMLYSWGLNSDGQCGVDHDGDVLKPTPITITATEQVGHFACGARHSMMVEALGGGLYSWGCSQQGRLGCGNTPNIRIPVKNTFCGEANFHFVACGEAHSGAIDIDERVWTWGAGAHGRLGHGETVDTPTPQTIEVLEDIHVKQLALGGFHSVALSSKPQKVFTWGMGHANGQSADGKTLSFRLPTSINMNLGADTDTSQEITQIACGTLHTMFLLKNGRILLCGNGLGGRLGLAKPKEKTASNYGTPQMLPRPCGFALRIKGDATVMNFKRESEKLLEAKEEIEKRADGQVKVAWDVEQICCGQMNSAVLTVGGSIFVWGDGHSGQLGLGQDDHNKTVWIPRRLPLVLKIEKIAIGTEHCLASSDQGHVFSWGKGELGQLGTGRQHDCYSPTKIEEKYLQGAVICIGAGDDHSGAIVQTHEGHALLMWGSTENGKLGLGPQTAKSQPTPREVDCDWGEKVGDTQKKVPLELKVAQFHTAVIVGLPNVINNNAEVWAFGGGLYGRLGIEDNQKNQFVPRELKELNGGDCLRLSVGAYHSAAILGEQEQNPEKISCGDLWVWGRNKMVCEPEHLLLPKKFSFIEESSKFNFVSCSNSHTLCVTDAGMVFAWGENHHGQLGLASRTKEELRPQQIKGLPGVAIGIECGPTHSLALLNNGEVFAWGNQSCGRLGLQDQKIKDKIVWEPKRVKSEWASIEEITVTAQGKKAGADEDEEAQVEEGGHEDAQALDKEDEDEAARMLQSLQSGQKVQQFATMQNLLKAEKSQCRETALKKLEDEITAEISGYLKDIQEIPQREKVVLELEADAGQGLGGIMRLLKHAKVPDGVTRSDPRVSENLSSYEELMWVLQQQPCYLSSLSTNISSADESATFNNIVSSIFSELEDPRTLHLCMTLLKLIIDKEVERASNLHSLFVLDGSSFVATIFAWFAKKPQHYSEVVWPFMDHREKKNEGKDKEAQDENLTLLRHILKCKDTLFSLDMKEFKAEKNIDTPKDTPEEMAEFMQSLKEVKDFMTNGPFEKAIMAANLHPNIRKMLYHAATRIKGRTFPKEEERDQAIPPELDTYQPLLNLVLQGILLPFLENPEKYSGLECGLPKKKPKLDEEGNTINNIRVICKLLTEMMKGSYDQSKKSAEEKTLPEARQLEGISRQVKLSLLRYVKEMSSMVDDTETHTTIDVYTSHYDRHPHSVSVRTVDLLKISNLCLQFESKVRQTDDDPCVSTCHHIGNQDEAIKGLSDDQLNMIHNFIIKSRFLLDPSIDGESPLTVCRTSSVPMPPRFCVGSSSLVKGYVTEQADSQAKVIEDLFRETDDVKSNTWSELKKELEAQWRSATSKNPPNYVMAHKLRIGKQKVEELQSVDFIPADLLNEMADKLMARNQHRSYLEQVLKGLHSIKKAKLEHALQIRTAEVTMRQMAEFTTTLALPKQIKQAAEEFGNLTLETLKGKMVSLRLNKREKLANCTFAPQATMELNKLKKDRVIIEVNESMAPQQSHKMIKVTLSLSMDGGMEMSINMMKNKSNYLLRELKLTREQLLQFKKAKEGSEGVYLPDGTDAVILVDPLKLGALATKISTGT